MVPKEEKESPGRHPKSPDRPPASDPNPTTTPSHASVATGGAATASLLPSSALTSAPPTAATTTQPALSALLPPPPSAPPLSIQETHQERISGTSEGRTTSDSAGPSTAPSASAASASASTSTPSVPPIMEDLMLRIVPDFVSSMVAMQSRRKADLERLNKIVSAIGFTGSELEAFQGLAEKELKAASDSVANLEKLKGGVDAVMKLLAEKWRRDGSSDSCGGSDRENGCPDSGSGDGDGDGDGHGGGVCV